LAGLGYPEITLTSPYGKAQYSFRVPDNWSIQDDGLLNLDLSYSYHQVEVEEYPTLFGDLTIILNGQTLTVFTINQDKLDHYQLSVPLPASLLTQSGQTWHTIELLLDADYLCLIPHKAKLVVHPSSSTITLNYSQLPLELDLAKYPQPFYQRAFQPDYTRFVLPAQSPTNNLASDALAIAAKLGDFSSNRLIISATTDLELAQTLSSSTILDEHLLVIGQPQDNSFITMLNDITDLPVALHSRQLDLVSQGPTAVAAGNIFTYVYTVTNPTDRVVTTTLINPAPAYSEFVDCSPECTENEEDNTITWDQTPLLTGESKNFRLTLSITNTFTGVAFIENTVTLVEADLGPVNAATLTATVVAELSESQSKVTTRAGQSDYFFSYNGQAVPAEDGILQEIQSPWSQNRAILIVTGLSNEAVHKASQALSSQTRFPGMSGPVALVRQALPLSIEDTAPATVEMTLADLGYTDQIVRGGGAVKQIDYFFEIPYGWQLTEEAYIDLNFNHSDFINYADSGLTALINGEPVASTVLDEKTANNGTMRINLGKAVQGEQDFRFTAEIALSLPEVCADPERTWFVLKNNSKIYLAHQEESGLNLNLKSLPYPFHLNPSLTDLMFALPAVPTANEWETALRLAASLGRSAGGRSMAPLGILGDSHLTETLANYHLIVTGRPSRNPLLQQLNKYLPQPFIPGSDEIEQLLDSVVLRLPAGYELGYLQLIPSPWTETRAILAVTGTTDQAVKWATDVLVQRPWDLTSGNLALIRANQINTIDTGRLTRGGIAQAIATAAAPEIATSVATTPPGLTATPTISMTLPTPGSTPAISVTRQTSPQPKIPQWLAPLVGLTALVVIAIFVIAFLQARKRTS
jgi:hypothetical protein